MYTLPGEVKYHNIASRVNIPPINPAVIQAERYRINNNSANNSIRPDQIWGQANGGRSNRNIVLYSSGNEKLRMTGGRKCWQLVTTDKENLRRTSVDPFHIDQGLCETRKWCCIWYIKLMSEPIPYTLLKQLTQVKMLLPSRDNPDGFPHAFLICLLPSMIIFVLQSKIQRTYCILCNSNGCVVSKYNSVW